MGKKVNLIGQRFGRLVVIEEAPRHPSGHAMWICKCDCGNTTQPIMGSDLRSGKVQSCKCLRNELLSKNVKKHGMAKTRLHRIWQNMKNRCSNPNVPCYSEYGGRGITVCDEWVHDFQAFHNWAMANGYADDLSIDRVDNDGNYCPENCRWVSQIEQSNNLRKNIIVEIGEEKRTLAEWAHASGIKYTTIYARYMRGWRGKELLKHA